MGDVPTGIWGAVLLPIDVSGEIDWVALGDQVDILCASDLAGIYTNGTAGEFHNQTDAEFEKLSDIVAHTARKLGKPFQIGVSNSNPRVARQRLEQVMQLEPDAVQFTLPDWWPPSMEEIGNFMRGMQETAGKTPLVLYNPPHAKKRLGAGQIAELRAHAPGLVGAKLGGGDAIWYAEHQKQLPDFSVFVPGHSVAYGRPLGASGSYSNVACLSPNGAAWHWKMIKKDPIAATELETRINSFLSRYILPLSKQRHLSDPALDKLLAAVGGWGPVGPRLLWPYCSAGDEDVTAIAKAARRDLPELFN